jgi:hypothetical protein
MLDARFWKLLFSPPARYIASWIVAFTAAAIAFVLAWQSFDDTGETPRRDGNSGHATIDFGGQYLMGRMLIRGQGRSLFHRNAQRIVLREVYPSDDESPTQEKSDVENMMVWTVGEDDPQSGPIIGSFLIPLAGASAMELLTSLAALKSTCEPHPGDEAAAIAALSAQDPMSEALLLAASYAYSPSARLGAVTSTRLGGPLYPPIDAFVYAPLAVLPPRVAYRVSQALGLLLGFAAALAAPKLSQGRVWWPVAAALLIVFPGFAGSLNLGQNTALTLLVLMWGWVLMDDHPLAAGLLWGLLVYKPVWWLSFFFVPLLTSRWRVCIAMTGTALALFLITLPIVGLQSWFDWLQIGREAVPIYTYDKNWILLSRDVLGIPRRWLDFTVAWTERRDNVGVATIAGMLYSVPIAVTFLISLWRRGAVRETTGPGPAFLLFGAWMSCIHFMYYDVTLAALPVFLLFVDPARYLEPLFIAVVPLNRPAIGASQWWRPVINLEPTSDPPPLPLSHANIWVLNRVEPTLLLLLVATTTVFPLVGLGLRSLPYDTLFLMALWAWCGGLVAGGRSSPASPPSEPPGDDSSVLGSSARVEELVQLGADVGGSH